MKIICVGRNYAEHAKEMKNDLPTEPVIFMKPKNAILLPGKPIYYPEFTKDLHYECEVIVRLCKNGKFIQEKFAKNYYDEVSLGIDFTARDIQSEHKEKGLPWELAKAFDNSAVVSNFLPKADFANMYDLKFELQINKETRQNGHTSNLLFSFEKIIAFVSQYITLKKGDLIFTGTPAGVGKINKTDRIAGWLENRQLLGFDIK